VETPMKDIHATAPAHGGLMLQRVGITGVRKPVSIMRPERVVTLSASFSVSVDLPSGRKGSDLSRDAELLAQAIDWPEARPVPSLESACASIAQELLARHPYAMESRVEARAEYFLSRGVAPGRESLENFTLLAEASGRRTTVGITVRRAIGAEAVGLTACPCAMETCREKLTREYPLLADPQFESLPMISHNQRNRTYLIFELVHPAEVEVDRVIDTIEAAQSSPTYAILKRGDEGQVVLDAHRHPKFVEDVLRDLLASLPERFPNLPDDTTVRAGTVSEESIHKYNVEASHRLTLGELRRSSDG